MFGGKPGELQDQLLGRLESKLDDNIIQYPTLAKACGLASSSAPF